MVVVSEHQGYLAMVVQYQNTRIAWPWLYSIRTPGLPGHGSTVSEHQGCLAMAVQCQNPRVAWPWQYSVRTPGLTYRNEDSIPPPGGKDNVCYAGGSEWLVDMVDVFSDTTFHGHRVMTVMSDAIQEFILLAEVYLVYTER